MRLLARILIAMKEKDQNITDFVSLLHPKYGKISAVPSFIFRWHSPRFLEGACGTLLDSSISSEVPK